MPCSSLQLLDWNKSAVAQVAGSFLRSQDESDNTGIVGTATPDISVLPFAIGPCPALLRMDD